MHMSYALIFWFTWLVLSGSSSEVIIVSYRVDHCHPSSDLSETKKYTFKKIDNVYLWQPIWDGFWCDITSWWPSSWKQTKSYILYKKGVWHELAKRTLSNQFEQHRVLIMGFILNQLQLLEWLRLQNISFHLKGVEDQYRSLSSTSAFLELSCLSITAFQNFILINSNCFLFQENIPVVSCMEKKRPKEKESAPSKC